MDIKQKSLSLRKISYMEVGGWLFMAVSLVMLINSVRLCFCSDIWYDELFTMGMVSHSYGELIAFTARDVHPPLYYFIVKFILDLCKSLIPLADSVVVVKITSVMPYFLLFIYALAFLRKRFGIFGAGLFMFCVIAMPQMSAYTVEMRMYSWALFFVTATFFHAYELVSGSSFAAKSKAEMIKNYVAICIYGLAAAYTQYFACVAVIVIYLYLLVWILVQYKKYKDARQTFALRGWFVCAAFSVLAYLPWLSVLMSQIAAVRDNYWILPLTWRSLGGCVKFVMKPAFGNEELNFIAAACIFVLYIALFIACGYYAWNAWNKERVGMGGAEGMKENAPGQKGLDESANINRMEYATFFYALAGSMVLCGLTAFGFIASIIIRPVFVYRYMIPAMGCFWLSFVLFLNCFCVHNKAGSGSIGKNILFYLYSPQIYIIIIVLAAGIADYRAFAGEEEYRSVLMEETELAFSDIAQDDIILYNFDQLQAVCGYYMPQESYLWNAEPEKLIVDMFGNKGSIQGTKQIEDWLGEGKTVWFFGSFNSREDIRAEWEKEGIHTEEKGSYMLERYWFNVYRVFSS